MRYAAWLNATQELSKVEGIAFDSDLGDRIYVSWSEITAGSLDNDSKNKTQYDYCGPNDIRLNHTVRGCILEVNL